MTEADMQVIVQEVMRRMFAGDGSADSASANGRAASSSNNAAASAQADHASVVVTNVVTRSDIETFVKGGKKRLLVKHGGLVTPLARDLAAVHGLEIIWAGESNAAASAGSKTSGATQPQHTITGASANGKSALTCLRCNSCLESAYVQCALTSLVITMAVIIYDLAAY